MTSSKTKTVSYKNLDFKKSKTSDFILIYKQIKEYINKSYLESLLILANSLKVTLISEIETKTDLIYHSLFGF